MWRLAYGILFWSFSRIQVGFADRWFTSTTLISLSQAPTVASKQRR